MGFEEIRDKLLYLHKRRDLSKRRNKFTIIEDTEDKENKPLNRSRSSSRLSGNKKSESSSLEPKKNKDLNSSTSSDPFETYIPHKDPKNKARYLPPSKLKKQPSSYQGRRVVKFKEESEYSEEHYGSLKKEKKPPARKIVCVTEIMADISDTESGGDDDDTTSQEKTNQPLLAIQPGVTTSSVSSSNNHSVLSQPDTRNMLPPDKFDFLNKIRKRSQKRREKDNDAKEDKPIPSSVINSLATQEQLKAVVNQPIVTKKYARNLEHMIMRKFNDKKSVNKIIQKTAKLQKNLDYSIHSMSIEEDTTGDAIRHCMMQRIKSLQRVKAANFTEKERKRGKVDIRFIKLQYQNTERLKRKTKNFNMYDQKQLDFPDANNLLNKKLAEFEFDNDVESDEDEIAKSSYIRLKDLTISLKEALNKGDMLENDSDDMEIKKAVGYSEE